MAEYYALLNRAVSALPDNTEPARQAIYDKARRALIVQLKAIQPPLTAAEISRQRLELEEAVRRVERESNAVPANGRDNVSQTAARALEEALSDRPAPQPPPTIDRSAIRPIPIDRPPVQPTPFIRPVNTPRPTMVPRQATAGAAAPAVSLRPAAQAQPAPRPPEPEAQPVEDVETDDWIVDAPFTATRGDAEVVEPFVEPETIPTIRQRRGAAVVDQDEEDDYGDEDEEGEEQPAKRRFWRRRPKVKAEAAAIPAAAAAAAVALEEPAVEPSRRGRRRERRRSSLGTRLLMVLMTLVVFGGLAFVAWTFRDDIGDMLASVLAGNDPPATARSDEAPVSLGAAPDVRVVGAPQLSNDPLLTPLGSNPASGSAASGTPQTVVASAPPVTPVPLIAVNPTASEAILYEEPVTGGDQVRQTEAQVSWLVYTDPGDTLPMLIARIEVPSRGMRVDVSIERELGNPGYSHNIDVFLPSPSAFPNGGLESVPRLMVKQTEASEGSALQGTADSVPPDYFWIGLSASALESNLAMLRDREWFDLPIIYKSGQRAILTFSKGETGQAAFERVLAAWGEAG